MPTIKVKIKWDKPDDKNWLNKFNVAVALSSCCPNTNFEVEEIEEKDELPTFSK